MLKREKERSKRKKTLILAIILFVVLALHLIVKVETIKIGYRKTRAILEERKLEEENMALKKEISQLRSPERLRKKGKELGLCPPRPDQMIFIGE